MFARNHFFWLQPAVFAYVKWIRLIHDHQFFSHTVISVCLRIFHLPTKQCPSHSSSFFLLARLKIADNCSMLLVLGYVIRVVSFCNYTKLTFGNQKRLLSNRQRSPQCMYMYRSTYSTTYTCSHLVLSWFSTCLTKNTMNTYVCQQKHCYLHSQEKRYLRV